MPYEDILKFYRLVKEDCKKTKIYEKKSFPQIPLEGINFNYLENPDSIEIKRYYA